MDIEDAKDLNSKMNAGYALGYEQWKKDTKFQLSTGCVIDGHWGVYGATRSISFAEDFGFPLTDSDRAAITAFNNGYDSMVVEDEEFDVAGWILDQGGLADTAEEWLNENVAQPGFSFGWSDGEFFYMNNRWFEDDDAYTLTEGDF